MDCLLFPSDGFPGQKGNLKENRWNLVKPSQKPAKGTGVGAGRPDRFPFIRDMNDKSIPASFSLPLNQKGVEIKF
ncbi:MAG: hypothetical protein ACLFPR_11375 [Desulfococcaceae bacterium]